MTISALKSYAQKSGKSISDIEKMWDSVEKKVKEDPKNKGLADDKIYALVNGTVKKNLGLREDFSEMTKLTDRLQSKIDKNKEVKDLSEASNKDQEMVMKAKDVISHVNQALDVLKDLKKASGTKGERFKYFSTYLSNFLQSGEENNQTGFVPWIGQLETDSASNVASVMRGGESDGEEMDMDDEGGVEDMSSIPSPDGGSSEFSDEMEEATEDEIDECLSEGVDKKGEKVDFDILPESLQNALKEFGVKSKIDSVVLQSGEKSAFFKVFLDMDTVSPGLVKKFAEAAVSPSWISSHKDKVVLGFKAPKKKVKKKESPKEEVKEESSIVEGLDVGVKRGTLLLESEYASVKFSSKKNGLELDVATDQSHPKFLFLIDKGQSHIVRDFFRENIKESVEDLTEGMTPEQKKKYDNIVAKLKAISTDKAKVDELKKNLDDMIKSNLNIKLPTIESMAEASASVVPGVDDVPGTPAGQEHTSLNPEDIAVAETAIAKAKEALTAKNFDEIGNLFSGLKATVAAKMNTLAERMFKSRKITESDAKFLVSRVEKFVKSNKSKVK